MEKLVHKIRWTWPPSQRIGGQGHGCSYSTESMQDFVAPSPCPQPWCQGPGSSRLSARIPGGLVGLPPSSQCLQQPRHGALCEQQPWVILTPMALASYPG